MSDYQMNMILKKKVECPCKEEAEPDNESSPDFSSSSLQFYWSLLAQMHLKIRVLKN